MYYVSTNISGIPQCLRGIYSNAVKITTVSIMKLRNDKFSCFCKMDTVYKRYFKRLCILGKVGEEKHPTGTLLAMLFCTLLPRDGS